MIHVKNLRSTRAFEELCSQKTLDDKTSNIDHLRVLDFIVYVFIHQEDRKSALFKAIKFVSRAQLDKLIEYDDHIIYRVFLKKNYKIIRVKNLKIYENSIFKTEIDLLTYDVIMIDVQKEKKISVEASFRTQQVSVKRERDKSRKESTQVFITELTSLLKKN